MEHQLVNNVTDILDTNTITNMPPPPYSPAEDTAKVSGKPVDTKALTNGPAEAVRLREREATRMDMSVRRSKVLSRAGLDDPVFFKMSQLEQLVNSLQSALNDQSMAIHDVHGQLTEINDVLHMMQTKDEPVTTTTTTTASTTTSNDAVKQPVEPERLVQDLRAAAAKFSNNKKTPASTVAKAAEGAMEGHVGDDNDGDDDDDDVRDPLIKGKSERVNDEHEGENDDDDDNDAFEDAEDDGNYLRLCSMLENLIADANIAVESPVSIFPEVPTTRESIDDTTNAMSSSVGSVAVSDVDDEYSLHNDLQRRRQRRERRSGSGARIRPVKLVSELNQSHAELDDIMVDRSPTAIVNTPELTSMNEEEQEEDEEAMSSILREEVGLLDIDTMSTSEDGPDAVEVRFFCQVKRTGETPQQHEIRRRLVLPLLTGNNLMPSNIRRIICGDMGATDSVDSDKSVVSAGNGTRALSGAYRGSVIRRALGTVQLMYWLLLFTLGVLMLDTYLCELAGSQAVHVVDGICPEERRRSRRRPYGLLATDVAHQSTDPATGTIPSEGSPGIEYTGMKPVTLAIEEIPMKRNRSRRNSL
ncbi:hypothetical protein BDF22DRAFT_657490 [Syncephalis plumigaleata]|nr:hypothetical protein BDF22DRAFT_657490 [Syncephalis plumigaleata]